MRRNQRREMSNFKAGALALVIIVIGTYLGFTKSIPFRHHYTIKAVFASANNIKPNSPVRIAGINVGKVTDVEPVHPGEQASVVSMRIDNKGLPIHKDATLYIRPRIFLEGNFFVDLHPGSPSQPTVSDGDTLPINQGHAPVQLDQILTSLQTNTRSDLKKLLKGLGKGLAGQGGAGFNRSIHYWAQAYKGSAIVNDATLGLFEHDLSNYIKNAGTTAAALDRNPAALKNLITDFNTTAAALAAKDRALGQAIHELPRTLHAGLPALSALNASFPPLRRFIKDFRPAVRSSGPALKASTPFITQARLLVRNSELRGLVHDLKPAVPPLTSLNQVSVPLYDQVRPAASCNNEVIIPWSHDKISDATFPTNLQVYQEATKPLGGLAGESRSGDANGQWFRVLLSGGNYAYPMGTNGFFLTTAPIEGVNPPIPADYPYLPLKPDVPCETQQSPDLRTVPGPAPAGRRANLGTPALQAAYAKIQAKAVSWLQGVVKHQGDLGKLRVSSVPATLNTLKTILHGAAPKVAKP